MKHFFIFIGFSITDYSKILVLNDKNRKKDDLGMGSCIDIDSVMRYEKTIHQWSPVADPAPGPNGKVSHKASCLSMCIDHNYSYILN